MSLFHRHDWYPEIPGGSFPGVFMSVQWHCRKCEATKRESLWVHS